MHGGYGEIYVADGASAQAVSSTPAKMTGFATEGKTADDQGELSVVPDVANDKLTVKPGAYLVNFQVSGTQDGSATDIQANLRGDGTEIASGQCRANFGASAADNSMGFATIIEVTEETDLTVYLEASASVNLTPIFAQLSAVRLW